MPHLIIDTGNTAFMLLCSSLVMLMTPGLAFFYGGHVGCNVSGHHDPEGSYPCVGRRFGIARSNLLSAKMHGSED
jgi:hypothetical protein